MNGVKKGMGAAWTKRPRRRHARKVKSFRKVAAFGLGADRDDIADPVQFTSKLRKRRSVRFGKLEDWKAALADLEKERVRG